MTQEETLASRGLGIRRRSRVGLLLGLALALQLSAPRSAAEEEPLAAGVSDGVSHPTPHLSGVAAIEAERLAPPDLDAIEAAGAVVGEIVIRVGNVFDAEKAGEDNRAYRLVNRLHRRTRESTLRALLLFRSGDKFTRRAVEESERLLREARYLYDAEIRPLRYDGDTVDLVVESRDVWSLKAGVSFARSGGSNSSRIGIEDENFLGWGKSLAIKRKSNVDRTSQVYRYEDPSLFGSRGVLSLEYRDNSDGALHSLDLERPFFALDSRWSAGARAWSEDRVDSLYALGKIRDRFRHEQRFAEVYGGLSHGLRRGRVHRWTAGFTFIDDRFQPAEGLSPPDVLPGDRTLAYPWVEFTSVHDGYIEIHQLDKIGRTEDLNLGGELSLRLGVAADSFGADRNQAIVDFRYGSGLAPGDDQLLFWSAHASGRYGSGQEENVMVGAGVRYYLRDWAEHVLCMKLQIDAASNLDPENQLLLGGDSGLRGYPLRYLDGDRRVLFTLEQRFYTDWEPFKLFRVGAAVFADIGSAWYQSDSAEMRNNRPLRDVGLGLRLGSTRSSEGSMIHIDVAVPLDGDPRISNVQFLVKTREAF